MVPSTAINTNYTIPYYKILQDHMTAYHPSSWRRNGNNNIQISTPMWCDMMRRKFWQYCACLEQNMYLIMQEY